VTDDPITVSDDDDGLAAALSDRINEFNTDATGFDSRASDIPHPHDLRCERCRETGVNYVLEPDTAGGTGEKSWSQRGVVPDSTIFPSCPLPIAALLAVVFRVMLNRPGVT
jgi:hypothetical protein